jgi:membrane protein implicated in regulation of membrane protease activity
MLLIAAVVLLLVLPTPWNLVGGLVCAFLFLGELFFWNRTVRERRKVVGSQTLLGQQAEVREACRPLGQVFVAGELWAARCEEGADVGETVTITAVDGLTLEVTAVR